ncbi:hypothetical protein [Desulfofundulus thermobenzoicus]|uniref:hypothetical protein n=1 Tax=Desulfofundulus thermobenzoicus TaxID=29376 RepID=UPI00311AB397
MPTGNNNDVGGTSQPVNNHNPELRTHNSQLATRNPKLETIIGTPHLVNDLVVYPVSPRLAYVVERDCRIELTTTPESCTCCTFRFNFRHKPGFRCRHIAALRQVLGLP